MRVVNSVTELIGSTPILRLGAIREEGEGEVFAKLEYLNPGGSVKDRIGLGMIEVAEREGSLKPGATIVEATAGNTGIGLALVGVARGYRVLIVMPEGYAREKTMLMRGLGAEIVLSPGEQKMAGAVEKARQLAASIPGAVLMRQFENPANPVTHYETTAREIWEQMGGKVDGLCLGAGTGGTFTGVARFLKERNPDVKCYLADPPGSILSGNPHAWPHRVEGIGNSWWPETLDKSLVDGVFTVPDGETYAMVDRLGRLGVLVASSSGANVAASKRLAGMLGPPSRVVTVLADSSERYLSKYPYDGKVDGEAIPPGE